MGLHNVSIGAAPDIIYDLKKDGLPSSWTYDSTAWNVDNVNGFSTKNYPNDYPANVEGEAVFTASVATSVLSFSIDEYKLDSNDYVEIRDGKNSNSNLLHKLSGDGAGIDIESTSSSVYFKFYSKSGFWGSDEDSGFRLLRVTEKDVNGKPSCKLEQTGEAGIAVSTAYDRTKNEEPVIEITNCKVDMRLANISENSIVDSLKSKNTLKIGYTLIIVKDDDSIHQLKINVDPGTKPYNIDTSAITAGEIPSRVFLAEEYVQFNNLDIPKGASVFGVVDGDGELECVENFTYLEVNTKQIFTTIFFNSIGNKMVNLIYDLVKE